MLKGELNEKKGIDYTLTWGRSSGWIYPAAAPLPFWVGPTLEHRVPAPSPDPELTAPRGLQGSTSSLREFLRNIVLGLVL